MYSQLAFPEKLPLTISKIALTGMRTDPITRFKTVQLQAIQEKVNDIWNILQTLF